MPVSGQNPEAVRNPRDRRVSRTRHAIDRAFLLVLERRGYDALSVSDIVREADVGRATFYEHYLSKDDLLRGQLRRVLEATVRGDTHGLAGVDATALFAHVRDVRVLYRLVAGRSATARSMRVLREALEERAATLAGDGTMHGPQGMPLAATARVWAATLSALLSWWTEQGMTATPDEMQAMLSRCTAGLGGAAAAVAPPTGIEPVSSA